MTDYKKPVPGPVEGKKLGKLTKDQEALADSNFARARKELGQLRLAEGVGSELRQRELSLSERVAKLEKYVRVLSIPISGPMVTPSLVRGMVREELLAHTAETQHNQAAYHATVNVAYVRAREVKVVCELFMEMVEELTGGDTVLAQKFKEKLQNLEKDYQRELNHAIHDALLCRELKHLPSSEQVVERLTK